MVLGLRVAGKTSREHGPGEIMCSVGPAFQELEQIKSSVSHLYRRRYGVFSGERPSLDICHSEDSRNKYVVLNGVPLY